jgi:surface carbohydrate biosynthesis protein
VLFPIEIGTRELDSKLVMASALAAEGCRCIVGYKEALKAIGKLARSVVWQGKSLFSSKTRDHIADDLLLRDSAIMFIHDEGGIHQVSAWKQNVLKKHRVDDLRTRDISRVCVWGERQKQVISEFAAELSEVLTVTGSPRFDLCHPKFSWLTDNQDQDEIVACTPYILVCTRFVNAAHAEGQEVPFLRRMYSTGWPDSFDAKAIADVVFTQWQQAVHDFADLVVLVKEIALAYPKYTLVLRPHPSENLTFYRQAFSRFKNVTVRRDKSVLNWIRSAALVIHSNCTTGIEAVLAKRPVLNLLPASANRIGLDLEVAREAGVVATSIFDALEKVDAILAGGSPAHAWSTHAKAILNNLKVEAIPAMVKETLAVMKERGLSSSDVTLPAKRSLRAALKDLARRPATNAYVASKRGTLNADHIETLIAGCKANKVGSGSVQHIAEQYVVLESCTFLNGLPQCSR